MGHLSECRVTGATHAWIMSYLSNRYQAVLINGVRSDAKLVTCGVPQGSVLGPLLFCIYLTGLNEVIRPFGVDYILYADDLQLFTSTTITDIRSASQRMESCIHVVELWLV
jgi:hypothetical protein